MNNMQSTTTTQQETDIGVLEIVTFDVKEVLSRISSNQSVIVEARNLIRADGTIRNCLLLTKKNPQDKHTPGYRIQQMNLQCLERARDIGNFCEIAMTITNVENTYLYS